MGGNRMKFEEQFPSLEHQASLMTGERTFNESTIQEHCLDKQRLIDALSKMKSRSENRWTDKQIEDFLLITLNVEEK